jgi:NAD(P)-dependent dehydrogenase (short-subunit alcohol dehydrogenase family)
MSVLKGRGAVVTGGGRGIGAAIAHALASDGARVLVASRTRAEIEAVAAALREQGAEGFATVCDVTDEASVEALVAEAHIRLGAVDILINNAGDGVSAVTVCPRRWRRSRSPTGTVCWRSTRPGRSCARARSHRP